MYTLIILNMSVVMSMMLEVKPMAGIWLLIIVAMMVAPNVTLDKRRTR